jgi:3-vinyl bacteriochlorophyllide hydratase
MFTRIFDRLLGTVDCCPWVGHAYGLRPEPSSVKRAKPPYLYSPAERRRRDATKWTLVQGVLAPVQFAVFLTSLGFVLHFLVTGQGFALATASVLVKTGCLYAIMVTGAIWEKEVFGQYLFARAFFWEDVFSFLVIGLHTLYVLVLVTGLASAHTQMLIALAAYVSYVINATQFIMKLRAARLEAPAPAASQHAGQMG